jgi:hypothetical protein
MKDDDWPNSTAATSIDDEQGAVRGEVLGRKSEMMRRRGAGSARTKRYTDELGEHWVKQFKQFSQKNADPNSTVSAYTGHSSGFSDAGVQLPPPPIDAAPPTQVTQISSDQAHIKDRVAQHQRPRYSGGGSSEASHPRNLQRDTNLEQEKRRQAETRSSNASSNAAAEHRSVTGSAGFEPAAHPRGSSGQVQHKAEAAKPLHQRLLGGALVAAPTEMRPTELYIFPRGPHSMRLALTTHATATDAVRLGSKDVIN